MQNEQVKFLRYDWKLSPRTPFRISLQEFPEAGRYPVLDVHEAFHLQVFLNGSLRGRIGSGIFTCREGDVVLIPPWEIHGGNVLEKGLRLLALTIDTDTLLNFLLSGREQLLALFALTPEERAALLTPEIRESLRKILRKLPECGGENDGFLQMKQWLVILEAMTVLLEMTRNSLPECRAENFRKLEPVRSLLADGKNITVEEAAAACGLSASRFSHLFKETCRESFAARQLSMRLNRAAVNLRSGMSVKAAAAACGFYDASHFSRYFIRKFGMPPSRFAAE